MKIYKSVRYDWTGSQYVRTACESYEYYGTIELLCGASSQQNQVEASQQQFMNQMMAQSQQVFGQSSQVFNQLVSTFSPIVAAGPSQQGFSPQELSNLNSQAITQTGQSYKNAKEAVGEAQAANGGGNTALPSGAQIGEDTQLASSAANQTAGELSQITQADYTQGNQNYNNAVAGLESAPGVFNASTGLDNATTNSSSAAGNTASQIAQESNSWISSVTGALGGIAGSVASGGMSNLGKGVGFFG